MHTYVHDEFATYIQTHTETHTDTHTYICNSYNTGMSALPDIYMHDAQGRTALEGECVYIRWISNQHIKTFW